MVSQSVRTLSHSWIADPAHPGVRSQSLGKYRGAALGTFEAQIQRANAAQGDPGFDRPRDSAPVGALREQSAIGRLIAGHGGPEHQV